MEFLASDFSQLQISNYNQYFNNERYSKLPILIDIIEKLKHFDINIQSQISTSSLSKLLELKNEFCHIYFDDEDCSTSWITLSEPKIEKLKRTYDFIITRTGEYNSELEYIGKKIETLNFQDIYKVIDENMELYLKMYQILEECAQYYKSIKIISIEHQQQLASQISSDIMEKVEYVLALFEGDAILNPLDMIYNTMSNLQFEMLILINLLSKQIKIYHSWCKFHNINWIQLELRFQTKYMKLINNYISLVFELAFTK